MKYVIDNAEIEKSKQQIIVDLVEYKPSVIVSKAILKKITGDITAFSFDKGEELGEKVFPFDMFILIIDGAAQINTKENEYELRTGEGIVIPAHTSHSFLANKQFKMITTILKSAYED